MPLDPVGRRYAQAEFTQLSDNLVREHQKKSIATKSQFAGPISRGSGSYFQMAVQNGIQFIEALTQARLDTLVKAYEKAHLPFDNQAVREIFGEVTEICESSGRNVISKFATEAHRENLPEAAIASLTAQVTNEVSRVISQTRLKLSALRDAGILASRAAQTVAQSGSSSPPRAIMDSKLVFLSHAAKDQEIAIVLKRVIEQAIPNCNVFVSSDTEDLRPGDEWVTTIRTNLRDARLLLLLASERSLNRPWVWYETGSAWSREIRTIPCCLGAVRKNDLSAPFSSYQALNADEAEDFKDLLAEIGRELNLSVQFPQFDAIQTELQALDQKAHAGDINLLTPSEIQFRFDAMNVSAKITQGLPDSFDVLLTNESTEPVIVHDIRLVGPNGIPLTNPYFL
jgi:hypothetical protein